MSLPEQPEILEPTDDVYGWVEPGSSIMFKAVTKFGDPIEISAQEARDIAVALIKLAERLEAA
jgi:hypothetical protein